MRDHGGNLDQAMSRYGGAADDWIDLSTGINRIAYPVPPLSEAAWSALPTREALASLHQAARSAYGTSAEVLAVAGAQAAIQLIPRLGSPGHARVLGPTYNEHTAALRAEGWQVEEVNDLAGLSGAELAVVVNPNNPDGRTWEPARLKELAKSVGRLIVDESFADPVMQLSLAPDLGAAGLLVLRSFGKFYGLAGLRLGFVLGSAAEIEALSAMAGPWPVSGPAIEIGVLALKDRAWAEATARRLRADATRLDRLAEAAGWRPAGGTLLFRLYDTDNAQAAQIALAEHQIWSRSFPYSARWIRLGLPGGSAEWARTEAAFADIALRAKGGEPGAGTARRMKEERRGK